MLTKTTKLAESEIVIDKIVYKQRGGNQIANVASVWNGGCQWKWASWGSHTTKASKVVHMLYCNCGLPVV